VDLNGDGHADIISGSYAARGYTSPDSPIKERCGLFQVLWGTEEGFKVAESLKGSDNEPLLIHKEVGDDDRLKDELFSTRVFSADLNGDGYLDLVAGNNSGSFYFFEGEGTGQFNPQATQIKSGENRLSVSAKSGPCLIDWDGDGDLDLISGSGIGGVNFAENTGSKTKPRFAPLVSLIDKVGYSYGKGKFGDKHISGPGSSTRVYVADVNGDGLFDLLVGDQVWRRIVGEGVKESEAEGMLDKWDTKNKKLIADLKNRRDELEQELAAARKKFQARKMELDEFVEEVKTIGSKLEALSEKEIALMDKREKISRDYLTGYIWVYYQLAVEN